MKEENQFNQPLSESLQLAMQPSMVEQIVGSFLAGKMTSEEYGQVIHDEILRRQKLTVSSRIRLGV